MSDSNNPVERRRRQNRVAQRKRRDTLKAQIEQLQANNAELKAFKENIDRATKSYADPEISNLVLCNDANSLNYTFGNIDTPAFDDDFLSQITESGRSVDNLETNYAMQTQIRHEVEHIFPNKEFDPASKTVYNKPQSNSPLAKSGVKVDSPSGSLDEFSLLSPEPVELFQTQTIQQTSPAKTCSAPSSATRGGPQRALKLAVINGHGRMVSLLIKHGADVNVPDESGISVLLYAVKANDTKMVELLLEKGADTSAADSSGMNALEIAVSLGHTNVAELLLEYKILDPPN